MNIPSGERHGLLHVLPLPALPHRPARSLPCGFPFAVVKPSGFAGAGGRGATVSRAVHRRALPEMQRRGLCESSQNAHCRALPEMRCGVYEDPRSLGLCNAVRCQRCLCGRDAVWVVKVHMTQGCAVLCTAREALWKRCVEGVCEDSHSHSPGLCSAVRCQRCIVDWMRCPLCEDSQTAGLSSAVYCQR